MIQVHTHSYINTGVFHYNMRATLLLLFLFFTQSFSTSHINFCVDTERGFVTSLSAVCPNNTYIFQTIGTNLFDIAWGAWNTDATSLSTYNLTTSLKSIHDAGASGITVARFFAAPWAYEPTWGYLGNASTRDAYWFALDTIVAESERVGIKLIPSFGYGCGDSTKTCNPSRLCPGETYRDLITNATSCTRSLIFGYARDFATRYATSSAILFWELGNELNLQFDACSYDKSVGSVFTTAEGLQFLRDFTRTVRQVEPLRPINSGNSAPRLRAHNLALTLGGGKVCVSQENPNGDCDGVCPLIAYDTLSETQTVIAEYYFDTDMVSAHWYSCNPPNGNYSWCQSVNSTEPITVYQEAALGLGKPLYIGEFGPGDGKWSHDGGVAGGLPFISAMVENNISLSTMWAFECPSHSDANGFCIHPGNPASEPETTATIEQLQQDSRTIAGGGFLNLTMELHLLPPPRFGSNADPACMDSSPYGYYLKVGAITDRWIISIQGGGWSPDLYQSWLRTQDVYVNSTLGSSRNWSPTSGGQYISPRFADWSQLYLPYCDGSSFSGLVLDLQQTSYGPHGNDTLAFRGASNMAAAVTDALGFAGVTGKVTEILVMGGSAGGMSTTLHVDKLGLITGATAVAGIPQCGFFLETNGTCVDAPSGIWCNASDQFKVSVV